MVDRVRISEAAREVAEPLIEGLQLRVAQQIRQFHRIGRSRTAGCRRVAERALGDALQTLRDELVETIGEADPAVLSDPATEQLVADWLRRCVAAFDDRFHAVLRQTEGYSDDAVRQALEQVTATVSEALAIAEEASGRIALPAFGWLAEPMRTRVVAWSEASIRALGADAAPAAAVSAVRALELLLKATNVTRASLVEEAAARGLTLDALSSSSVLEREPVPDEAVAKALLELLVEVAERQCREADGTLNGGSGGAEGELS